MSKEKIKQSVERVQSWIERHNYKGYDPGDGLNSVLRPLALGNRLAERILLQAVWKAPFNIRPLVGIKEMESTKARGYMALGYLYLMRATADQAYAAKAILCLDWLKNNKAPNNPGYSWGNHFDFVTRTGCNPRYSPIIVWTSLIGHAFIEAYEQLQKPEYLDVAQGICEWILKLPREETDRGTCLSYYPFKQMSIHNSNLLGAGFLARANKYLRSPELLSVAQAAVTYSCSRQLPDGSWWYGEAAHHRWNDNFHTGYNLDSLRWYVDATGDADIRKKMLLGLDYFKRVFFEPDGKPRYYHDRTYPIDIQCASQAIDTLTFFSANDPECLALAQKVADWTIVHMQDRKDGHFYYRDYGFIKARTPYIHWGEATMFKALAHLFHRLGSDVK
jgi:rhamnogalacturonyl hydrolase YesR